MGKDKEPKISSEDIAIQSSAELDLQNSFAAEIKTPDADNNEEDYEQGFEYSAQSSGYHAGLPTQQIIVQLSGLNADNSKLMKHSGVAQVFEALQLYHTQADKTFTISRNSTTQPFEEAFQCLDSLIVKIKALQKSFKYSIFSLRRSSTVKALMPSFSSLLMSAFMAMGKVSRLNQIWVEYALESNIREMSVTELLASEQAAALTGKMGSVIEQSSVSIGIDEKIASFYNTGSAASHNASEVIGSLNGAAEQELEERIIPPLSLNSKDYSNELHKIMVMIDTLELRSDDAKISKRSQYLFLHKLFQAVTADPEILLLAQNKSRNKSITEKQRKISEALKIISGQSLHSAKEYLMSDLINSQETIVGDITDKAQVLAVGGMKSNVIIDRAGGKVLRVEKADSGLTDSQRLQKQVNAPNAGYDEAIYKINRLLGFNVIAKSKIAAFTDIKNELNIGTKMQIAKGKAAVNSKKGSISWFNNPKMLEDIFRLSVVDYISLAVDRHLGNFYINEEAAENEATITGIDNDLVFNTTSEMETTSLGYNATTKEENPLNILDAIKASQDFLASVDAKYKDLGQSKAMFNSISLEKAFPFVPQSVYNSVMQLLDLDKLEYLLRPYVSRASRFAAVDRARELKEHFAALAAKQADGQRLVFDPYEKDDFESVKRHTAMSLVTRFVDCGIFSSRGIAVLRASKGINRNESILLNLLYGSLVDTDNLEKPENYDINKGADTDILRNLNTANTVKIIKELCSQAGITYEAFFAMYDKENIYNYDEVRDLFLNGRIAFLFSRGS